MIDDPTGACKRKAEGAIAVAAPGRFCFHVRASRTAPPPWPALVRPVDRKEGREDGMSSPPMQQLARVMRQSSIIRFIEHFAELFPTAHLKDLVVEEIGPGRRMVVDGRAVVNF